jgi:hypothetical protein
MKKTSKLKKLAGKITGCCLLAVIFMVNMVSAQIMPRQDKLFIQHGIQLGSWVRNDHASEGIPVPTRQPLVIGRTGRYVRVQLPNTEVLSLAEVQVFSHGVNIALNKTTQQSSDKGGNAGLSPLAVDGNTDGNFTNGSVTHTIEGYAQMEPWWQVDLGSTATIDSVVLWNRTDCCGPKLKGFYLFISDNPLTSTTLAGTIAQAGVSHYVQPLIGGPRFPPAAELNYAHIMPTYFEVPGYNYEIHQQDPTLYWSIAKGAEPPLPASGINRGASAFEQSNGFLNSLQSANVNKLYSICLGDEEAYSPTTTAYIKSWFDVIRAKYPNVLFHNNQYAGEWTTSQLSTYMQTAQPDMITFDQYYYHYYDIPPGAGNTYTRLYQDMQVYRNLALGGNDGTGSTPIGFGGYMQAFSGYSPTSHTYDSYRPSESEFNLNAFAYLTMGAKWINEWIYYALFWDDATSKVTPQYAQVASIGKQVANLSPHLSRLRTTDVRFIPGQNSSGTNASPNNLAQWDVTADPYVKGITAANLGAFNNGLKGDVLIGYFKPVPGIDNTAGITMAPIPNASTHYFMLLNGLSKPNGPGNNSVDTLQGKANLVQQKITLNIDFGTAPIDTLYKISKSDGTIQMVNLTHISGSQYTMEDILDGGMADLFYWKNQGLPPAPPIAGTSLQLSTGSVSAGNIATLSGANKFTLEAWVKFNDSTPWGSIFYRNGGSTNRIVLSSGPNNSLHVVVSNGQVNYANSPNNIFTANNWYHVAVVYDGTQSTDAGKLKLYVNGLQQSLFFSSGNVPSTAGTTTAPMVIGAIDQTGSGSYFNGTVDEVRIWNTALSQSDIATWRNLPLGSCHPNAANLQVYWQFNNSSNSSVATPSLGTTNTGNIVNGTYVAGGWATGQNNCPATTGKSVQFTAGYISGGNVTQLNNTSKFTVEAWTKFNTVTAWATVFCKQLDGDHRLLIQTGPNNTFYANVSNGANAYGYTVNNIIAANQWYHVAVVFDGTQTGSANRLKLYINGVQNTLTFDGPGSVPATTNANTAPFVVGSAALTNTNNYLNGIVDEVRVWNTALSPTTLTTWKDKSLGSCHPNIANLQLYWPLNDNTDPTLAAPALSTAYTGSISAGNYITDGQAQGVSGCSGLMSTNNLNKLQVQTEAETITNKESFVYPNPVEGVLNVELYKNNESEATITVFNTMGQVVFQARKQLNNGANQMQIDFTKYTPGLYILRVKDAQGEKQFKVIKK